MRRTPSKYPKLARWFQENHHQTDNIPPDKLIVFEVFRALHADGNRMLVERWCLMMQKLFGESPHPDALYLKVEDLLRHCDAIFSEILSEIVHMGIMAGSGKTLLTSMSQLADQTKMVTFRFLAAWAALNIDDFDRCITECEKVDQPFAPVFTIQGQAFMELGRTGEATEAFQVAAQLSPMDILAWFQLAKAYHLTGSEKCWETLVTCHQLAPTHVEVAAFLAISALSEVPADQNKCIVAFNALYPHLENDPDNTVISMHLFRLSLFPQNRNDAALLAKEISAKQILMEKDFLNHLPQILTRLQELEWYDISQQLLSNVGLETSN